MSSEEAWKDLQACALAFADAVKNGDKRTTFFEIALRGAARNYADARDDEDE